MHQLPPSAIRSTTPPVPDALGSTVALGDSAGTLQTQYTYEPFGYVTQTGSASTSSYKYTGREDDGSGLDYYRARYYHPRLQRFIAEDPIGISGGGANFYAYVGNSPIRYRDPSGLIRLPDPAKLWNYIKCMASCLRDKLRTGGPHGAGDFDPLNDPGTAINNISDHITKCDDECRQKGQGICPEFALRLPNLTPQQQAQLAAGLITAGTIAAVILLLPVGL